MRTIRRTALAALVLITPLACAPDSSSDVASPDEPVTSAPPRGGSEVEPDDPVTSAPPTGGSEVEPDDPGGGGAPAVSLPQLPVGGDSDFVDDQDLQCANVSWIVNENPAAELRRGIEIDITGFRLDTSAFEITRSGCEDRGQTCVSYTFSVKSDSPACVLAVRTKRPLAAAPDDPRLGLSGTIRCVAVTRSECRAFVAAALQMPETVALLAPEPDVPGGESSQPSSGESSAEGESSQPASAESSAEGKSSEPASGESAAQGESSQPSSDESTGG